MSTDDALRELGRGVARLNLKLDRVQEQLGPRSAPSTGSDTVDLDCLFDLIEAVQSALARREPRRRRLFRPRASGDDLLRGLAVAIDEALERLGRAGIEPAPTEGAFDPQLHRAIEVVPASRERAEGSLAATHRRGWLRREGERRVVLRTAQVSVHGSQG